MYCGIFAVLLLICGRLFYLQVLQIRPEDPDAVLHPPRPWQVLPAYRGAICDRHGEILAADRPFLDVEIDYGTLKYPKLWLRAVQTATGRSEKELLGARRRIMRRVRQIRRSVWERGRRYRRVYEETIPHTVAAGIPLEAAARIEAAQGRFAGVKVGTSFRRDYPHGRLACQVIGYLGIAERPEPREAPPDPGIAPGDRVGRSGAEKQFDHYLRGEAGVFRERGLRRRRPAKRPASLLCGVPGSLRKALDRRERPRRRIVLFPAEPGRSVFLTLDRAAQQCAEESLAGKEGAVVVMDVTNGELLVLASAPLDEELSRATQDSVPSGSVIKPIVALAAAAYHGVSPDVRSACSGSVRVGGRTWRCSHRHGAVDMRDAIAHSCNIYFWELGRKIGAESIVKMAGELGLGRKTGVDLPHEWPGRLPRPERVSSRSWYVGDTMNLSIGQGILQVTPLQVAVAMAAVANGGKVLQPRILMKIAPEPEPEDGPWIGARVLRRVSWPPDALQAVRDGMRGAVARGTARRITRLRDLKVAAKTGTAETNDPHRNHAWLAGYVPFDAPRYAFAVVVHNTPQHGAAAAGPIAADVLGVLFAGAGARE